MKLFYITFRSVTFAQRGESLMKSRGIRCTLQRTPRWMEEQGCGYALRIWTREIGRASELLAREGIPYKRIYGTGADGQLEELVL